MLAQVSERTTPGSDAFTRLLHSYFSGASALEIANTNRLALADLAEWIEHPNVRPILAHFARLFRERAAVIADDARASAIETLKHCLNAEHPEARRRAATIILNRVASSPPSPCTQERRAASRGSADTLARSAPQIDCSTARHSRSSSTIRRAAATRAKGSRAR